LPIVWYFEGFAHGSADEFREYKRAAKLIKGDIRILTENAEAILRGENIR
jgi:hypothetical protein